MIGNEPDGTNINDNYGSTHIENLQKYVKDNQLDVGFAFDGDADCCIAVDEKGNKIDGDYVLYICGKYLKEMNHLDGNTVVATIMSYLGLFKALELERIDYCKTSVGDRYVNEAMLRNGYVIGGEQSGHVIFAKHAITGDGILTAIMIMEVILKKNLSLTTLCSGMKKFSQKFVNLRVTDKKAINRK